MRDTSLDEVGLDLLVHRNVLSGTLEKILSGHWLGWSGSLNLLCCGCVVSGWLILSGCDVCSEGENTGYCQKHEKLFHNCFCVFNFN